MTSWLRSLKLSKKDQTGIKAIVLTPPPFKNWWACFEATSKVIIGGAITEDNTEAKTILKGYSPIVIALALCLIITHEIGHSIYGDSESLADVYMCHKAEQILKVNLSNGLTMGRISMTNILDRLSLRNWGDLCTQRNS